jgi:hypothetical protein
MVLFGETTRPAVVTAVWRIAFSQENFIGSILSSLSAGEEGLFKVVVTAGGVEAVENRGNRFGERIWPSAGGSTKNPQLAEKISGQKSLHRVPQHSPQACGSDEEKKYGFSSARRSA